MTIESVESAEIRLYNMDINRVAMVVDVAIGDTGTVMAATLLVITAAHPLDGLAATGAEVTFLPRGITTTGVGSLHLDV
jgi:hypothetical protein